MKRWHNYIAACSHLAGQVLMRGLWTLHTGLACDWSARSDEGSPLVNTLTYFMRDQASYNTINMQRHEIKLISQQLIMHQNTKIWNTLIIRSLKTNHEVFVVLNRVKNNQIIKFTRLHFFNFKNRIYIFVIILKFNSHIEKLQSSMTSTPLYQNCYYCNTNQNRWNIWLNLKSNFCPC